jgi:lambda family phage tail tape measure protein
MAEEYIVRAGLDSRGFTSGAADIERAIGRVSSASNLLRNGLAALGVALSVQKIIQVNTEFERLGAQLETVTGSVGAASLAFEKLENFAATTPFQLNEVVEAFTQLKARGLDPSIASLTAWGDLGSSMGRSVGDAIRAVGTATVGEYESLKSFGIQASQAGDKVAFTFKGTTELVEKNAQSIEGYLKRLAQNNFAGSMERQSRTLGGAFSNLEDAVAGAIRKFGEGGFNDALRNAIKLMTTAVSSTGDLSASMGGLFGSAIQQAADLADKLGQVLRFLTAISGESEKVKRGRANELIPSVGDAIGSLWGIYSRFVGKPFAQGLDSAANFSRREADRIQGVGGAGDLAAYTRRQNAEDRELAVGDPFKAETRNSASAQLSTLRGQLERQASFAPFVGTVAELLKQLGDAQTGLNTPDLINFARTGKLPQAGGKVEIDGKTVDNPFTTGSRDALIAARTAQFQIADTERKREYSIQNVGTAANDERAAAFNKGDYAAIDRITAAERARQAVLRDGRDLNKEIEQQEAEIASRNREGAAQRLASVKLQVTATQTLVDAVRDGVRDTSALEARNEALAAQSENAATNVEQLTQALIDQRRATNALEIAKQEQQLRRVAAATGQFTVELNTLTKAYEVRNRELEIANRLTDEMIVKYGDEAKARAAVNAQLDQEQSNRDAGTIAERTKTRVEAADWTAGAQRGLMRYQDTALNMASTVEDAVVNTFQSMEDSLVKFVQTGKLDFNSLANSIIADLIRIQIRSTITSAIGGAGSGGLGGVLGKAANSLFGLGGAFGPAVGGGYGAGGMADDFALIASANGNVFNRGNVVPFARGGVVNSTTYFPMANGDTGMMGEAGPEAIMPLARDASGRLGVRGGGGGGGGGSQVVYNIDARGSDAGVERRIRMILAERSPWAGGRNICRRQSPFCPAS